ncbi:Mid2 domain-containing protein [Pleurotus pulmonarius]
MALARPLHVKYLTSSNLLLSDRTPLKTGRNRPCWLEQLSIRHNAFTRSPTFLRRLVGDTHITQLYVEHRWHKLMYRTILWLIPALRAALSEAKHGLKHGGKEDDGEDAIEEPPSTASTPSNTTTIISTVQPSSSSSSATSTSLPFQWDNPSNTSTCQSTTFTWRVSDSRTAPMTITVTNERVAQQGPGLPLPNTHDTTPLITRTVNKTASPSARRQDWPLVDVPQGWYVAIAFNPNEAVPQISRSPQFFVNNGTDVSCLPMPLVFPSLSPSPSSPSPSAADTTPATPSRGSLATPQLIGTICGVVGAIALLVIVFTVPSIWNRFLPKQKPKRPGGPLLLY